MLGKKKEDDSDPKEEPIINEVETIYNEDDLSAALEKYIFDFTKTMEDALKAGAVFSALRTTSVSSSQLPSIKLEIVINQLIFEKYMEKVKK